MRNDIDLFKPSSLSWVPRSLFGEIQRTMGRALNGAFEDFPVIDTNAPNYAFVPSTEVEETDSYYLVKIDMPGIPKEDVKIEMTDDTLLVSGERKEDRKEKKGSTRIRETRYGRFERAFTLPSRVDDKKIEASHENGVLSIYLPKLEAAKVKEIKVGENKGFFKSLLGEKATAH